MSGNDDYLGYCRHGVLVYWSASQFRPSAADYRSVHEMRRVRKAMLAFGEKHFSAEDGEHSSTPAHRSDWLWLLKEVGLDKPDAIRNSICDVWKNKEDDRWDK